MRNWIGITLLLFGAAGAGCHRKGISTGDPGTAGTGVGILGVGGNGGQGVTGVGGAAGIPAACSGASDERVVVADQRILRLTANETLNTIRYLIDDTEAAAVADMGFVSGDNAPLSRRFPPLEANNDIDSTAFVSIDQVGQHVGDYVHDNFATVTACATATDACATAYLDKLAARAYRRQLTQDEQTRFRALYTQLRNPQTVNGYLVTFTIQEATGYAVQALLTSPQMVWRWELGDPAMASTAPAGIPLTDAELATHLAFFLTDQPPDDTLLAAANAGTLRANLAAHVDALLASQASRDWMRTIIETYFTLNQLPGVPLDPAVFPTFSQATAQDMATEARRFLDNALWNGVLTDLLLSRTTFLNSNLAANIYGVATPPGATATSFIQTTLPAAQRSGLLTNAGLLTTRSRPDGSGLVVQRGMFVASVILCMPFPGTDTSGVGEPTKTSQEQVADRAANPACGSCHGQFDPFGLALDNYDGIGRFRTVDDMGRAIDAHTHLPAALGGAAVANGVELAQKLAASPAFTSCMARTLLRYAMVDRAVAVDAPWPPQQPGCATADIVQRYQDADGKTFTDLVRATASAPAFVLRRAAP
jgi:hypothetical protein